jgi:glyceraldehyde 3-phosphate dehydrogenase
MLDLVRRTRPGAISGGKSIDSRFRSGKREIMKDRSENFAVVDSRLETLPTKLGINGLGRIGKLNIWHHVARRTFQGLVVNAGREAGKGLQDIADYLSRDSTYGPLERYIHGFRDGRVIEELNETSGTVRINGVSVEILRETRNPAKIPWREKGVLLAADCTGAFRDPTAAADSPNGSLRGHLEGGASKVILSAPFKIKDKTKDMPDDAVTSIQGINEGAYDPKRHHIISVASCTTTCLAYMVKPLLDHFGPGPILGASMVTVHATTGSQEVLDRLPDAGSDDLRRNRGIFNNIILTTTGAASALGLVIPEMKEIGFIAESVRIPTNTGSLIILMLNIQNLKPEEEITREQINRIYQQAAEGTFNKYLSFTETQNVSSDIIGATSAALIEGRETRAHTGIVQVALSPTCRLVPEGPLGGDASSTLQVPVTQVVVYGWYDNELGSFTNMMGERTVAIAKDLMER